MKRKVSLCASALCFLIAYLILLTFKTAGEEELAARISPEILRFHVLAESNSSHDQNLKMGVKGLVLDYVRSQAPENSSKEELILWLKNHKTAIESMSEAWLSDQGASYPVTLQITRDYFPTKSYGDMAFPCGTYDALRITIGEGRGRNWWCVLYPALCFTDPVHAVVPEASKETLSSLLDEEDYHALLPPDITAHEKPKIRVKLRLFDALGIGQDSC